MVSSIDFMPTLLEYAGLTVPGNLPGQSFVKLLDGRADRARESVVIYDEYGSTRMARTEDWKYVHRYPDGPHELYDLRYDPGELANRVEDPDQASRIFEMRGTIENWFDHHSSEDKDGRGLSVTGGGQLRPIGADWEDGSQAFTEH